KIGRFVAAHRKRSIRIDLGARLPTSNVRAYENSVWTELVASTEANGAGTICLAGGREKIIGKEVMGCVTGRLGASPHFGRDRISIIDRVLRETVAKIFRFVIIRTEAAGLKVELAGTEG